MKKFKIGDKVKVIKEGYNANQLNVGEEHKVRGVYSINDWKEKTFEVISNRLRANVTFDPCTDYYAYKVALNGTSVGYVYEEALELVEVKSIKKVKVIFAQPPPPVVFTQGELYVSSNKHFIVMCAFTEDAHATLFSGMIITSTCKQVVGNYSNEWKCNEFIPFKGKIEIEC